MSTKVVQQNDVRDTARYAVSLILKGYPGGQRDHSFFLESVDRSPARVKPHASRMYSPPESLMLTIFPVHSLLDCRSRPSETKFSSGLFGGLAAKLRLFHSKTTNPAVASSQIQSPTRRSGVPEPPQDPASIQRRQAALQQCGLIPIPRKDLSQLEQELDRRLGHVSAHQQELGGLSTAEKVGGEREARNKTEPIKQGDDFVEEVTRGSSVCSQTTESSLPALSPTTTASSLPSVATPRDSECRSNAGSADPEALVEEEKGRTSILFQSNRSSGSSSRKSTGSENSPRWSAIAKDFSFRPLGRPRSGISTLPVSVILNAQILRSLTPLPFQSAPAPAGRDEPTAVQTQSAIEQSRSKPTKLKSKSVIASLGLKKTLKTAPQPTTPTTPPTLPSPVRQPTIKIVEDLGSFAQTLNEIEDDESRRLTELAFMEY